MRRYDLVTFLLLTDVRNPHSEGHTQTASKAYDGFTFAIYFNAKSQPARQVKQQQGDTRDHA
jgi:hypothetical protein